MTPDIQAVLRLQSLDTRAAELQKEIDALPKHTAQIERQLDQHLRKLDVDRAAVAANQRDRKRLEDDIKVQEQKITKLRDQLMQAKTNEQYRAFQHEITYCETEIRKAEDKILDLMSESEPLEKNVKIAEQKLNEEKEQVEREKEHARKHTAEDQQFLADVRKERAEIVAQLDPAVVRDYDRIRIRSKGVAIADATEGRCSACMLSLRPQFFQDLKKSEKIMHCESCGRILFYNPPVSLEHELHQTIKSS
jgi:predicted  nucleic acid-binding Zn-ribbon protein